MMMQKMAMPMAGMSANASANTIKAMIVSSDPLPVGKPAVVTIKLTQAANDQAVALDDLKKIHTRKLHLLIVDSTLTDYHHEHPTPTDIPGEYKFTFTPQKTAYRIWADVIPVATDKQEYAQVDLGMPDIAENPPIRTLNTTSSVAGYTFNLTLEEPLVVGKTSMARVDVTDRHGKPVKTLEPVMGAFGHIVGFSEDYKTIAHIHPMGAEPTKATQRGGSILKLHLEPKTAGFLKLFVQTRIQGQDIFAPFGVMIAGDTSSAMQRMMLQQQKTGMQCPMCAEMMRKNASTQPAVPEQQSVPALVSEEDHKKHH